MRLLGLGFTNSVGTWGVLDVCLGCGGVDGVCEEWVCDQDLEGWVVLCLCESGFLVSMAGPSICILCWADTCAFLVHPVFNPVAPSVQSCCTLSISASYHVFVYGRYRKSRLVCVCLSDLELSQYHPLL